MSLLKLSLVAAALAAPTRIRVLLLLGDQAMDVGTIARAIDVVPSVASFHVRHLLDADLVTTRRRGRRVLVARREGPWRQAVAAFGE
jgi:DNA-binding transcriptional ArsR family regulator